MSRLKTTFFGSGRQPSCPANPAFPDGVKLDISGGSRSCTASLSYPAECVGRWLIECEACGFQGIVTAAGRSDDPRSITVPCQIAGEA